MSYILDLRRVVGKRTLIMPCACVIIGDGLGRVLLQHRADNNLWSYHGGAIEIDEEVEAAAKREVYEEIGLTLDNLTLFRIYSGKDMHYTYPNGDDVSPIDIVYICHKYHGDIKLQSNEVLEVAWFDEDTLPYEMTPQNRRVILEYLKYLRE
ncbi:MAG: NUDIX domain-containing protein [Erysipelotrichaceae bacterium]|nr:NUDIX domain-containing protein [Erysipelotrichaceae bacterium]